MTAPLRLRLSRKGGFSLQALSIATNGLLAVNVARPSKWGNPYQADGPHDHAYVVGLFRDYLARTEQEELRADIVAELHGKNLACWCRPDEPCHADVLLEIANR